MILTTELHRHLDASLRPQTIAELSGLFSSGEDVKNRFWLTRQMTSLKEVLDCFTVFQSCLATAEALTRVGREAIEDAEQEGIENIELRYSPSFASEKSGISWAVALQSILKGLNEATTKTDVHAGLICIVSRDFGLEAANETIDFAIANKRHFIAVDLAGNEAGHPARTFEEPFKRARDAGLGVTIHAGEAAGPESVWEAIDILGATRIGHGIQSIKDKELMARLARDGILLEICPTSNYVTKTVDSIEQHPLPRFLEKGIPVSISTDDPGIFGVTLPGEVSLCQKKLGLSDSDLNKIQEFAAKKSFLFRNTA